jgi:hypothetical protein
MIRYVIINTLGHNVIELCTVSYISILVKHLQVSLSFYPSGAFRVIDIESLKIDCLRFVMCPLLAPAFQG